MITVPCSARKDSGSAAAIRRRLCSLAVVRCKAVHAAHERNGLRVIGLAPTNTVAGPEG
jgi:hypothetical protein